MAIEIERKFLVANDLWRAAAVAARRLRQGYLAKTPWITVRVRCAEDWGALTVKGPLVGLARQEFNLPITHDEARNLLADHCRGGCVEKVRHTVPDSGAVWVVDEFRGRAAGLVLAEIELERADQAFERPAWLGAEVSHDPRYRNSTIARLGWGRAAIGQASPV